VRKIRNEASSGSYKQDFTNQKNKILLIKEARSQADMRLLKAVKTSTITHDIRIYNMRTGTYASHMQQPFRLFAFFFGLISYMGE